MYNLLPYNDRMIRENKRLVKYEVIYTLFFSLMYYLCQHMTSKHLYAPAYNQFCITVPRGFTYKLLHFV